MDDPEPLLALSQSKSPPVIDTSRPTWRVVLFLAWPVLLQQFLVAAVGLSDRFLGGRFELPDPSQHVAFQAAQTNAHYMSWVFTSYSVLVSAGSTALVARFIGARNRRLAVRTTNQSILLAIVLGVAGAVGGLTNLDRIVAVLQLSGEAAEYAAVYLRPLFLLLPFQVVELAGIACLVGAGDTRPGLYVLGGVALLNLPLAWVLCWGLGSLPGLGFEGIALGTALSNLVGGSVVLILLARGRAGLRLRLRWMAPDWGLLWRLLRVSVPAGLDSLSIVVGQLWFLSIVNRLGYDATTAHGIALGWESMAYLPGSAFGTAAMALVGQNLGAGRPVQAARSG
jgi:putative MATE family efflux protein